MLTCMAPHRMTKAHPLACDCKPGWLLFSLTHPLTCTCEPGWVFSFQCKPTHLLACNCETGWDFWSFFLVKSRTRIILHLPSTTTSICPPPPPMSPRDLLVV